MLLPFMGFLTGCFVFGLLGAILLKFLPCYKLSILDLILFLMGALPGAFLISALFGWLFANPTGRLSSTTGVVCVLISMLVGGIVGGLLVVRVARSVKLGGE